ncbi:MAG: hypothetical protein Q8L78_05785 [Coxiellaceae bacterium]|nr:hypothetical protein [Coxiellaceae bacterium]
MRFTVAWESSLTPRRALPIGTVIGSEVVESVSETNAIGMAVVTFESNNILFAVRGLSPEGRTALANDFRIADHPNANGVVDQELCKALVCKDLEIILALASSPEALARYKKNRATADSLETWVRLETQALEEEIEKNPSFLQRGVGSVRNAVVKAGTKVKSIVSAASSVLPSTGAVGDALGDAGKFVKRALPEEASHVAGKVVAGAKKAVGLAHRLMPAQRKVKDVEVAGEVLKTQEHFSENDTGLKSPKSQ